MLTALSVAALLTMAVLLGASLWGVQRSEAIARQTFDAKDVAADILPPPLYLIELRLVLSQAHEGLLSREQAGAELARLRKEYDARIAYWSARPPHGLEAQLMGAQHQAAQRFFDSAQQLLAQPTDTDPAQLSASLARAHALYLEHRAGVDLTVQATNRFAEASVAEFDATGRRLIGGQAPLTGLAMALLLLFGRLMGRRICAPIRKAVRTASALEQLGNTMQDNAETAGQAAHMAREVHQLAEQGGGTVQRVVQTMQGIHGASPRIGEIDRRDRQHRLPDQHPGPQRGRRGGAGRRAGPRLRRGCRRGASPGAAQRGGRRGDRPPDP